MAAVVFASTAVGGYGTECTLPEGGGGGERGYDYMIITHCKTPSARFLVGGLGGEGVRTWAFCPVGVGG